MIKFGVEQENFIFKGDEVPSIEDIDFFLNDLLSSGFRIESKGLEGRTLSVAAETENGSSLIIKNDFCTHILEIAFPPTASIQEFASLYKNVFDLVLSSLTKASLEIKLGGVINQIPESTILVPCNEASAKRIEKMLCRNVPDHKFSHRLFEAAICATQIHLDILNSPFYKILPSLYAYEYLFPLLFTNSNRFLGQTAYCVRPLVWRDNFVSNYKACAFPQIIPNTESAYSEMIQATREFIRDYSFISPRSFGTVEFRSGCSQDTLESIIEMIALRQAIYLMADSNHNLKPRNSK